jgi:uncharacterized membrane-anchored protein YhcB (DUF1043 family)
VKQQQGLQEQLKEIKDQLNTLDTRLFREESDTSFLLDEINELEQLVNGVKTSYEKGIINVNDKTEIISRLLTNLILRQRKIEDTTPRREELTGLSNRFYAHLRLSKRDPFYALRPTEGLPGINPEPEEPESNWSSLAWGLVIGANVFGISWTLTELFYPGQLLRFFTNLVSSSSPLFY